MDNSALNQLLLPEVQRFIFEHQDDDVRLLALKKSPDPSWNYGLIMDQIKVLQKAKIKSLDLYETDGFIFPSSNVYEQASSAACAMYKSKLVKGVSFIDLTAGAGIDAYHISKNFKYGVLVERDRGSAELLKHNMNVLIKAGKISCDISVYNDDAVDYLNKPDLVDFVFIDPQRRETGRRGIFDLSSCSPNIIDVLPLLKTKSKCALIKTSPVLDIEKAITSLEYVTQVHVVQWNGECKEVLYYLDFLSPVNIDDVIIRAVNIDDRGAVAQEFSYKLSDEKTATPQYSMPKIYIYEPAPAFMKSGGFKSMSVQFNLEKIHVNSHLYTGDYMCENFPGKAYEFIAVKSARSKGLGIAKADLTLRNFPGNINDLRKKLKISDGGEHRIFATTLCDGSKKLLFCKKI